VNASSVMVGLSSAGSAFGAAGASDRAGGGICVTRSRSCGPRAPVRQVEYSRITGRTTSGE